MLTIDGSFGEGGGQVLRTSLSLAAVTGTPCRIENIRAGRPKPGLRQQHLTAVNAVAAVCGATVEGAALKSTCLTFTPGEVMPGDYHFSVATAGSATLVLQTVLPPLLLAGAPSSIVLEGGTHNPHAPPFDFLAKAFLPLINRMGPTVTATLERHGFFPKGGGRLRVSIEPCEALNPLQLNERGAVLEKRATAIIANLPLHIAERELTRVERRLRISDEQTRVEIVEGTQGPGNVLIVEVQGEHVTEVFTGFGRRGVSAEEVALRVAAEVKRYLEAGVPVGEHLADQLLLPMALAGAGSFVTLPLSLHATTNIDVIRMFLDVDVDVNPAGDDAVSIRVTPH